MKIYLAGCGWNKLWYKDDFFDFYRLNTFYHMDNKEAEKIHQYKDFLLDSGAFSFIGGAKVSMNEYIEQYINFINEYNVQHFFELDLYTIPEFGVKKTEEIRKYIETKTKKQSIPVFHKILGIDYYKKMCENYEYIAIGASGMHDSKWTRENPNQLKNMVLYANSKKVKVHGLGYTKIDKLSEIPFYSVDSTSWLSGNRFGSIYIFNGKGFNKKNKPTGMRVKSSITAKNNFYEWIKFQKYAEQNL